ncbi:hypothetical protein IWW48_005067 [Coemansia sp. RSA 1200]|nr:hypothetical protein IWW48_005067 [Coemansia sp. RSA 1200]
MGSVDDSPPDDISFFTLTDPSNGKETHNTAFDPRSLVVDDYVAAHIVTEPPEQPRPATPERPATATLEPRQQPISHKRVSSPVPIALHDQIHPLIRSRRLETPEDIAAWIAERKAKYPTDVNMRRKAIEQAKASDTSATYIPHQIPGKRKRMDPNDSSSDISAAVSKNPLTIALNLYGTAESDDGSSAQSSDESDGGAPEPTSARPPANMAPFRASGIAPGEDRRKLRVCKYFAQGSCNRGTACPFAHPESLRQPHTEDPAARHSQQGLLHRLLAKDIDRENHRVLQCLQYICDNDYLGVSARYDLQYQY